MKSTKFITNTLAMRKTITACVSDLTKDVFAVELEDNTLRIGDAVLHLGDVQTRNTRYTTTIEMEHLTTLYRVLSLVTERPVVLAIEESRFVIAELTC